MTDVQKLKEETNKTCHSLLISGGAGGVSLRAFEQDYRSMMGKRIPFQDMGYSNLESYLRDQPKVFKVYWQDNAATLMVRYVSNEDTAHIERLISQQKPKQKRQRKPISRPSYHAYAWDRYPRPRNQPVPKPPAPMVPHIQRGKIKGLLFGYRTGLLGSNFETAYQKRFSEPLKFREYGFNSMLELLKSMQDIVHIEVQPSGMYKIFPKGTSRPREVPSSIQATAPSNSHHYNLPPRLQKLQNKPQESHSHGDHVQQNQPAADPFDETWQEADILDNSGVNTLIQREIRQLLSRYPDGIRSARFQDEYRSTYKKHLDVRGQGYDSVIQLMSALPHVVTIERESLSDWRYYDAKQRKGHATKSQIKESDDRTSSGAPSKTTAPPLSEDRKETIRQVVAHYPEGVLLGELPIVYQDLTGSELNFKDLGFATLEALIVSESVSDIIHMEYRAGRGKQEGKCILFPQYREQIPRQDKLRNLQKNKASSVQRPLSQRRAIPADAVAPGANYRTQQVPRELLEQEVKYASVYVSTVVSPSSLWIQLQGKNTTDALEDLMDALETVYTNRNHADDYQLPDELACIGQVCVAIYPPDGDWHRCIITGFKGMDFAELYYVDYGSTYVVTKKSLKFLKMRFLQLPAQAIPAKLANIRPRDGEEWTKAAKDRMLSLVSDKSLIALITNVSIENVLTVCLTDTTTNVDIHINDLIVQEGLAVIDEVYSQELTVETEEPNVQPYRSEESSPVGDNESGHTRVSESERFVKLVQLTEQYLFHIIKFEDKPFVTSGEISNMLWPGKDVLRTMMRQKKINISKTVVEKDSNPGLFGELQIDCILGTTEEDGTLKSHVTLFDLSSVVEMLERFAHPSEELKASVQQQLDLFNPRDSYWKGGTESDDLDEDSSEEDDYTYGKKTLETALQSLQFRRKKILQAMQEMNAEDSIKYVEEVHKVEQQLGDIKKRIKQLEKLEQEQEENQRRGTHHFGRQGSQKLSEEDDLVTTVVSEQHDSYLEMNKEEQAKNLTETHKPPPLHSTPRTGVKTNPVAPMPASPMKTGTASAAPSSQPSIAAPLMAPGAEMFGGMGMPSSTPMPSMSASTTDPKLLEQQLLLQYHYNLLTLQSMQLNLQQCYSSGDVDSSALLQQQAMLAQMQNPMGAISGTSSFGRGGPMSSSTPQSLPTLGTSLGLGLGARPNVPDFSNQNLPPGGLCKKQ